MNRIIRCALVLACLASICVGKTRAADPVADWNAIAEQTIKAVAHPLPVTTVEYAIVHLAIYDAVESIDRRYRPYHAFVPHATGSTSAAVASAAYNTLLGLFSAQAGPLWQEYQAYLGANSIDPADPGIAVGAQVATAVLALRNSDGRFPPNQPAFIGNTAIGQWRPTPPANAAGLTPWLAKVTPFTMISDSQFRVEPPPALTSETYAEDYNEVQEFGSLNSAVRTQEQTDIGYFWADSGPLLWQNALRYISRTYLSNVSESARMFALAEVSLADAQIACWDSKYFYNFWRPITAIALGDQDGNAATDPDPTWQPLITTPNFPEYPSGHASISGAVSHALRLFFGTDELDFQMTTSNAKATQKTRYFSRFSQAEDEVIDARVYVGIHFRNSDRVARVLGLHVANWAFKHYFRPMDE